jgi:flagellar M-ring protein FliF
VDKANDIFGQLREIWGRFGVGQKIAVVATVLLVMGGTLGLSLWAGRPDFKRLPIEGADLAAVMAKLDDEGIDYRILADSRTLVVAADRHGDAQAALARAGLSGNPGEEEEGGIFGKASPLNREHQRELRAREAEKRLAANLERFQFIDHAQITITPATKRWFKQGQKPARASVQIATHSHPSEAQIQSITHVVLGGVEGLKPDQITIADMQGTILKYPEEESGLRRTEVARQRQIENAKAMKAQSDLDFAYGRGKGHVTVSAEIDWTRSKKLERKYDPDSGVTRNRTKSEESRTTSKPNPGGPVGARGPGSPAGLAADEDTSSVTTEMKDFNSTETELVQMGGTIKRLTVSVLIDESILMPKAVEGEAAPVVDPALRDAKKEEIKANIAASIGIDESRGDSVVVSILPVAGAPLVEESTPVAAIGFFAEYGNWIELGLYVFLALAFLVVALRTLKRAQRAMTEVLAKSLEDDEPEAAPEAPAPIDTVVLDAVRANTDLAGRNVRKWLYETAEA